MRGVNLLTTHRTSQRYENYDVIMLGIAGYRKSHLFRNKARYVIINRLTMVKSRKCNLNQWVCCCWQSTSTLQLHCLNIAMIKLVDEPGSIYLLSLYA